MDRDITEFNHPIGQYADRPSRTAQHKYHLVDSAGACRAPEAPGEVDHRQDFPMQIHQADEIGGQVLPCCKRWQPMDCVDRLRCDREPCLGEFELQVVGHGCG